MESEPRRWGERELKRFRRPFLKRPQESRGAEIVALKLAFQGSTGAFQRVLIATTFGRAHRREISISISVCTRISASMHKNRRSVYAKEGPGEAPQAVSPFDSQCCQNRPRLCAG